MWEEWIYKTVIAFLSIQALQIVFKEPIKYIFKKNNAKGVGFIRGTINSLLVSMIPFLRWVFVGLVVIVTFAGTYIKRQNKEEDKDDGK